MDLGFDNRGHNRQVNAILSNLCSFHNSRVVMNKSGSIAFTSEKHFALSEDARYGNAHGVARDDFWVK
jgi:hypothetical protein